MAQRGKREGVGSEQPTAANRKRSGNPHPGKGKPFEPGDPRINRKGAPSEAVEFQKKLREAFSADLSKPSRFDAEGKLSKFDRIIERIVEMAEGGLPWACEFVFDRIGGKPVHPHTGRDGGPIETKGYLMVVKDSELSDDLKRGIGPFATHGN